MIDMAVAEGLDPSWNDDGDIPSPSQPAAGPSTVVGCRRGGHCEYFSKSLKILF